MDEKLILVVIAICLALIIVAGWGWWRQRLDDKKATPTFEQGQPRQSQMQLRHMTFDEYCDRYGITDEEAPAAMAAYLNYVGGWDGTMKRVE